MHILVNMKDQRLASEVKLGEKRIQRGFFSLICLVDLDGINLCLRQHWQTENTGFYHHILGVDLLFGFTFTVK